MSNENSFEHLGGLQGSFDPNHFTFEFDSDFLIIHQAKLKLLKNQPIQTYKIPFKNIVALDTVQSKETSSNNVLAGGIAGAVLFGPIGAILGGMSGMGEQNITCFAISYLSENTPGEIKTLIFNAQATAGVLKRNKKFVEEAKNAHQAVAPSELVEKYINDNGLAVVKDRSGATLL